MCAGCCLAARWQPAHGWCTGGMVLCPSASPRAGGQCSHNKHEIRLLTGWGSGGNGGRGGADGAGLCSHAHDGAFDGRWMRWLASTVGQDVPDPPRWAMIGPCCSDRSTSGEQSSSTIRLEMDHRNITTAFDLPGYRVVQTLGWYGASPSDRVASPAPSAPHYKRSVAATSACGPSSARRRVRRRSRSWSSTPQPSRENAKALVAWYPQHAVPSGHRCSRVRVMVLGLSWATSVDGLQQFEPCYPILHFEFVLGNSVL